MHSCDVFMSSLITVLLHCGLYLLTFCIGVGDITVFFRLASNYAPESVKFLFGSTCLLWIFFVYIADPIA